MKQRLRIFLFFLTIFFSCTLLFCALSSPGRFDAFCDEFFQEELASNALTMHYTVTAPEDYGISTEHLSLGTYDMDLSAQKQWFFSKLLTLTTIARGTLSKEQQRTFDLLHFTLQTERDGLDYFLLEEPLVPSIGIQSQLPILLAEYTFYQEADVVNYLTLLSCIPEYFDSLLELEETRCEKGLFMDKETAEELISYCEEFLAEKESHFLTQTFQERLTSLNLSDQTETRYLTEHENLLVSHVFSSYEKLKNFLTEHANDSLYANGLSEFPAGTDYYAWLLRSEVGTDKTFEEIETLLKSYLKEDAAAIAAVLKKSPDLLEQKEQVSLVSFSPAGLTAYLSQRISKDFPETEAVSLKVSHVPSSLEPHLSPAFYLVPPMDASENHVIYLNNASLTNDLSLFTTLAHESYPGHLYQTVYETASSPHPIHRLFYFGGYIEGWATYAEQLSYRYAPISSDLATLLASSRAMTLNLYAHLDLYIHAYGWTEKDCRDYLKNFGITTAQSVHNMFLLVKQQPANYLKYYLGYLEILELRKEGEKALGEHFDLKEFHAFVLDYGPAPFPLLKKYMEEWLHSSMNNHYLKNPNTTNHTTGTTKHGSMFNVFKFLIPKIEIPELAIKNPPTTEISVIISAVMKFHR